MCDRHDIENPALNSEGNKIIKGYVSSEIIGQAGKTPLVRYTLPNGEIVTMVSQAGCKTGEAKCFLKDERGETIWSSLWPILK